MVTGRSECQKVREVLFWVPHPSSSISRKGASAETILQPRFQINTRPSVNRSCGLIATVWQFSDNSPDALRFFKSHVQLTELKWVTCQCLPSLLRNRKLLKLDTAIRCPVKHRTSEVHCCIEHVCILLLRLLKLPQGSIFGQVISFQQQPTASLSTHANGCTF